MRNIVRFLKGHVPAILLILMLLVAEAWCDLALPGYTSDIVDVGIQQGGIASPLPEQLQSDSMELLTLFLSDSDANTVRSFYTLSSDGIWQLDSSLSGTQKLELETILITPMALCYTAGQQEGSQLDMLPQAIAAGQITKEQLLAMKDQALSQMGDISDSMLRQMATEYLKDEYSALGKDLNAIQTHYLLITGGKMLGITLLSVLCVIVITLLASRIAAAVSRDLRDQVFRQVLSFSAAEMDQFSTASLITRSTNDIQQIQMVIVMLLRMVLYAPILGIGGILKVAATKTGLGWIIAVAVGCLLGLVLILVSIAMPKFKKMQTLVDDLNLVSREILTGVPVIRAFSREQHAVDHFDEANTNLKNNQLFVNRVMAIMSPLMMFIMYGITAMIVWFGAKGIDLGTMQTGDLTAFITYTMQIVMSFMMITMVSIMLPRASNHGGTEYNILRGRSRSPGVCYSGIRRAGVPRCVLYLPRRRISGTQSHQLYRPSWRDHRHHRLHRQRKVHAAEPDPPVLRCIRGQHNTGRSEYPQYFPARPPAAARLRSAKGHPVLGGYRKQPEIRR